VNTQGRSLPGDPMEQPTTRQLLLLARRDSKRVIHSTTQRGERNGLLLPARQHCRWLVHLLCHTAQDGANPLDSAAQLIGQMTQRRPRETKRFQTNLCRLHTRDKLDGERERESAKERERERESERERERESEREVVSNMRTRARSTHLRKQFRNQLDERSRPIVTTHGGITD
jgi:hypothetical protein